MGCTVEMRKQEERWRAESDMDALMRAEEIRKDPKRLAAAKALARERLEQAAAVTATEAKAAEPKKS